MIIVLMTMPDPIGCAEMQFNRTNPGGIADDDLCIGKIGPLVGIVDTGRNDLYAFAGISGKLAMIIILKLPDKMK